MEDKPLDSNKLQGWRVTSDFSRGLDLTLNKHLTYIWKHPFPGLKPQLAQFTTQPIWDKNISCKQKKHKGATRQLPGSFDTVKHMWFGIGMRSPCVALLPSFFLSADRKQADFRS